MSQRWEQGVLYLKRHVDICICVVLFSFFASYLTVTVVRSYGSVKPSNQVAHIVKQINIKGQKTWPLRKQKRQRQFIPEGSMLKKFSYYEEFMRRDMFHPFSVEVKSNEIVINPYVLIDVKKNDLPLIWKGTFQKNDGKDIFAQLNTNKTTSFVKKDDKILGYRVLAVTPFYVDVQKDGGIVHRLEKDVVAYEGDIQAQIYNRENGQSFKLNAGDFAEGWEVIVIQDDHVRLHKGGVTISVTKESGQ